MHYSVCFFFKFSIVVFMMVYITDLKALNLDVQGCSHYPCMSNSMSIIKQANCHYSSIKTCLHIRVLL
jgi:hypothetical protein